MPADTPLSDLISRSPGRRARCRWCAKNITISASSPRPCCCRRWTRRAPPMSDTTQTQDPGLPHRSMPAPHPQTMPPPTPATLGPARRRRPPMTPPRQAPIGSAAPGAAGALQPARSVPQSSGAVRCPGYARHRLAGAALPPAVPGIRVPVDMILSGFQQLLLGMPAPIAILVFSLLARQVSGLGMGAATLLSVAIGAIGAGRRRWSRWRWC